MYLRRNDGNFKFTDVADETKVADFEFSWGALFEDFNLDGRQDLVVAENYVAFPPHQLFKLPCRFMVQRPNGTFAAVEEQAGVINKNYAITPLSSDFNQDGYPDLVYTNLNVTSQAFINKCGENHYLSIKFPETSAYAGTADQPNKMQNIPNPIPLNRLAKEVTALAPSQLITERGKFQVYMAQAADIPMILQEIGRLRELTFRAVGEGTGKDIDLDEYDNYYYNLFIWDTEQQQIVGGYRVGLGDKIIKNHSLQGFYINSLFDINQAATPVLKQSIELGRSYILADYQKGYLPLFLLWRGILLFLLKNPQYRYLIGPVSISKYYSEVSKSMIVAFVKQHFFNHSIAPYFTPKTPFDLQLDSVNMNEVAGCQLKDLERFMATIEPAHIKVPILLKQYTKLNAQFIGFNLDPNFSDALDGLMLLDLQLLPPEILELLQEK